MNTPQTAPPALRRALVTGGASGIGLAVVRRLLDEGMQVVVADLQTLSCDPSDVLPKAICITLDVTNFAGVNALIQAHGPFDTLINAAGMDQHAFFGKTTPETWRTLLSVNLEAVFNTTHAVLPAMQAAGFGRIINVASEAGRLGSRGGSVYAAAKGGVIAFTRSIARENGLKGITANVVAPGPIDTPMVQKAVQAQGDKLRQAMVINTLMGRLGSAQEVAAAVAFLASPDAAYITGETLGVSGGMGCGA
jgi:2-hydroxycyclohexanecarboxyl-CoA dehydrogenase